MWRKFDFFVSELLQSESPLSTLFATQALDITSVTGGNGQLIFSDSEGGITICNQNYSLKRFQAHKGCINFAYLYKSSNLLVTLASDVDIREANAIEVSKNVANEYRKSLLLNAKYEKMVRDLGLLPEVTSASQVANELKVWRMGVLDESGNPVCARTLQLTPSTSVEVITAIAISDDNDLMCIGCQSGMVYYVYGDLIRSKWLQPSAFEYHFNSAITNLHFARGDSADQLLLYALSEHETGVFTLQNSSKRGGQYSLLESNGCIRGCSCVTDTSELIVGRTDGLFRFRGFDSVGCYAFEGPKQFVCSFKDCLLVATLSDAGEQRITIYNLQAHFIEFQGLLTRNDHPDLADYVFSEWGDIFIKTVNHSIFCLHKLDLQSKLAVLYKENLYTMALTLAHNNGLSYNSIIQIHKLYGDYLYEQGNYDDAVVEYIKTIGVFEPSYVIRKFLDAQRLPCLTEYLEAVHKQGLANKEHTTLLINCYCKMHQRDKLQEFIYTNSRENRFDVPTAIRVLTDCGWEKEALHLSRKYGYHHDYIRLLIEYERDFQKAVEYIHTLPFNDAESMVQEFGRALLDEVPQAMTDFIVELCIDYQPITDLQLHTSELESTPTALSPMQTLHQSLRQSFQSRRSMSPAVVSAAPAIIASLSDAVLEPKYGNPSAYIHLFASHSDLLEQFLSKVTKRSQPCDTSTWNTLLELVLRKENVQTSEVIIDKQSEVMQILTNPVAHYDEEEALILVQTYNSSEGQLYLYKKLGMYSLLLQHYLRCNNSEQCIAICKEYGKQDGNLWIQLLTMLAQQEELNLSLIQEILEYIEKTGIVPLLIALQIVSQNEKIQLGMVKKFIVRHVHRLNGTVQTDRERIADIMATNQRLKREIASIVNDARLYQSNKCANCNLPLELPIVRFVCGHSYHSSCLSSETPGCSRCAYKFKPYLKLPPAPTEQEYLEAVDDGVGSDA